MVMEKLDAVPLSAHIRDQQQRDEESNDNKKKKYVCKMCGETGHNSRNKAKCKQQEQQEFYVE
jgi:hypothetical protein